MPESVKDKILNSSHITVDIETLGRTCNAPIIQIAAVEFNPINGDIYDEREWFISWKSLKNYNMLPEYDSIYWWMVHPSQDVRDSVFNKPQSECVNIKVALTELKNWLQSKNNHQIWCHASFDAPIISTAASKVGLLESPLNYKKIRDIRCLDLLTSVEKIDNTFSNSKHNALGDCQFQARMIANKLKTFL